MGKLKSLGSKLLAGPYLIWMLLFTVVPLCLIIYNAFTNSDGKFTFKYVSAIAAPVNFKPLLLSFQMSLIVTIVCLLLAFPLAVILSKYSTDKNSFIVMIFILPMWMNFMLRTLAWRLILLNNGFLNQFLTMLGLSKVYLMNTKAAIIFGTAYDYFPFMVLPIYNDVIGAFRGHSAGLGGGKRLGQLGRGIRRDLRFVKLAGDHGVFGRDKGHQLTAARTAGGKDQSHGVLPFSFIISRWVCRSVPK